MKTRKLVRSKSRQRGVTLLEVAIASTLLVAFGGAAILATDTASKSFRTEAVSSELESAARRAMAELTELLRTADSQNVNPPAVATVGGVSTLDYSRVIGYDEALEQPQTGILERITFESDPGDPADGLDNDGDGLIDEGRIVHIVDPVDGSRRVVLCNNVTASLEGENGANGVDDNGNGLIDEGGFCLVIDGGRATLRLTLAQLDRQGNRIEHTFEKTVALRNTTTP